MFNFLRHISPKTKVLFIAFMLILAPGAIISYISLQSIKQKAENLRIKHRGTVNLVRDKLENDINQLISDLQGNLTGLTGESNDSENIKVWLRNLESENPVFKNLFLVNTNHGLISASASLGWDQPSAARLKLGPGVTASFKKAENAEFIEKDYTVAINMYREVLDFVKAPEEQALMISRIGRCFIKLGNYSRAVREYEKILEHTFNGITIGNVPVPVIAYTQIVECHKSLNAQEEFNNNLLKLFEYLLNNPWDLENGTYSYYLLNVCEKVAETELSANNGGFSETQMNDLLEKEHKLQGQIGFIKYIHQNILYEIESEIKQGSPSGSELHYISREITDSMFHLYYFKLPQVLQQAQPIALGFQFEVENILEVAIPDILATVDLGEDILVGILNENDSILYLENDISLKTYLAAGNFNQHFTQWKVALFDPDGKTIEQLTSREKQTYLALFIGIIAVMLIGIVLMAYSVIHESEISRLKSEFVSNVSHELKTPLALIRMFGETLDSGIVSEEKKQRKFYRIIRTESERLTHLINNVLDFSSMDAGVKGYNLQEVDLVKTVKNTLEAYRFHISDNGFVIERELPDEPILLKLDADAIAQVLLNLLNNAVKYSDKKKYILVKIWRNSDYVGISVTDHGIGISKKELGKIFDKFYRVPNNRRSETRGSGLGLTLGKHIVEAHGGTLKVASEEGKGSTFTIRLPLS
jgi:signal transduction histidine kinase